MNIKILVCCHKKDIFKESDTYLPIHVGKAISNEDLGIIGDNVGINISYKNASYCELTGMYWAWKNLKGADYIGLCHYRRFFDFNKIGRPFFPITTIPSKYFSDIDIDLNHQVLRYLENGTCIVAKPCHLKTSLYIQYCEGHYSSDIKTLGDILKNALPSKYINAFFRVMLENNKFSPFNMFIMSWKQFDDYCNWLFPLLDKLEKEIDITSYPDDQKRIYGYMGERLLNIYIKAERIKTKEYPILKISDEPEIDDISTIKYLFRSYLRDLIVKLSTKAL